jgi:hypothetical protein
MFDERSVPLSHQCYQLSTDFFVSTAFFVLGVDAHEGGKQD